MEPFIHRGRVSPAWVDYNGHMRDAYYVLMFSVAIDELMDEIGLDAGYRSASAASLYSLEVHVFYLEEVGEGRPLRVETRLLDADHKRLHLWQGMYREDTGALAAVQESLQMHVARSGDAVRAAPFPERIQTRVDARLASHRAHGAPHRRAGAIGIRR